MSKYQEYIDIGKSLNLSGEDLKNFAKQMVDEERETRLKERQLLQEERENELRIFKEKLELEMRRDEVEKQRRIADQQQKEFEAKLEADKSEMRSKEAEAEHLRQMDIRKLELEKLRIECEVKLRQEEIAAKRQEIVSVTSDSSTSLSAAQNASCFGRKFDLGLSSFDNNPEHLEA